MNKKFLITGHPRSGTGFIAALMQSMGYDVMHERMGEDGISSWFFAVEDGQPYIWEEDHWVIHRAEKSPLQRKYFEFEYTIHVVRDPLKCIASVAYTENTQPASVEYRAKHIPLIGDLNSVELAAQSWVKWNRLIKADVIIHLENAENELRAFLTAKELPIKQQKKPHHEVNTRKHPPLSVNILRQMVSKKTFKAVEKLGIEYGYIK